MTSSSRPSALNGGRTIATSVWPLMQAAGGVAEVEVPGAERDLRVARPGYLKQHGREGERGGGGEPDEQSGRVPGAQLPRGVLSPLRSLKCLLRVRQPPDCGVGELHGPRGALEQAQPEHLLQLRDALTERLLDDAQPTGGAGEVEFLGDGEEVAQGDGSF